MMEYIKIVIKNFKSRRLRSFLTLLGIIIGIVSIILLYSFADSIEDLVSDQFDRLGTNKLMIAAKAVGFGRPSGSQGLSTDDVDTVTKVKGVDYAVFYYSDSVPIEIKGEEMLMNVRGIDTTYINDMAQEFGREYADGRGFNNGEQGSVVVIGSKIEERFDVNLFAKSMIKINDKNFRVVGILEETGDQGEDLLVQIPINSMRSITNTDDGVSAIMAMVLPGVDIEKVGTNMEKQLERARGDDNFWVVTPTEIKEQAEETIGVVKLVILAIAAVSIIVGGLGIMNSMYTSVLERTKEIGIMKAIGAKNNDILSIFLLEAGMLGLIGGIISLIFSFLAIQLANVIIAQLDVFTLTIVIKPEIAAGAILFAIAIGMAAGLFPAYRAMKLKPVDALRYE
jgi:putative ABC transport system permease protein